MVPSEVEFPKFVPDQLLTSDDLNQLFGYLDEQNRMTRTNLIGIGIVCGLHVQVNSARTEVTITRGCGVTSEGYLVTVETKTYSQYKKYKVDTPRVYNKFYKSGGVPMDVWELRQPAVDPDLSPVSESFLTNKVILLFVELKEEDNKNCDPNSCDDKGINVTVSFLPMAVSKEDAALLIGASPASFGINTFTALPEMRMRRWDVPNTAPVYTEDIFGSYQHLLDKHFLDEVEAKLKNTYSVFGSLVATDYTTNPFTGLADSFKFIYDGTISLNQLIHIQYYYDLFSDLLLAYEEFRKSGTHLLSTCCPDSTLFPRHLLLGEAIPTVTTGQLPFRHYFIYSPLFDHRGTVAELKLLFRRLVLLVSEFFLPAVQGNNSFKDDYLRITPSMLWDVGLSRKAIPYYYRVNTGTTPLYLNWSFRRTRLSDGARNLSYHAIQYNTYDDFVHTPLKYDLEPYNFLRVEGIIGKSYAHVLRQVKGQIDEYRLPVDIIALSTDYGLSSLKTLMERAAAGRTSEFEMLCYFQDLESMYASLRKEILCTLCKELTYYYDFTFAFLSAFLAKYKLAGTPTTVNLLSVCNKGYLIKDKSLGVMIEFLHQQGHTDETLTIESFLQLFGVSLDDADNDDIPDIFTDQMASVFLAILSFFKIPLGIIRLASLLTPDLATFDVKAYCSATEKLSEYAKSLKSIFDLLTRSQRSTVTKESIADAAEAAPRAAATGSTPEKSVLMEANISGLTQIAATGNSIAALLLILLLIEDLLDHLDKLIYNCKCSALLSLKTDFLRRYKLLTQLRQFGYFTKLHPGIQHKAGVPMGGTFIVVYHARKRTKRTEGERRLVMVENEEKEFSRVYDEYEVTGRVKPTFIAGIILDETGTPLPGASVTVLETDDVTITASNGRFQMTATVAMPYTLLVEAVGYESYEEVKTDDDTNIRIVLTPAEGGVLSDLAQGTVIADFYLPYRCCSDCPPIQYVIKDVPPPPPPNQGPRADAGQDQTIALPTNHVTINGSGSTDPDGTIDSFLWTKLSGPAGFTIVTPDSAQTDVKDLTEGTYVFELTVTDNQGSIARDDMQVVVLPPPAPPNKPPVADAGKDITIVYSPTNNSVILDGRNSKDEDGFIREYKWSQVSGPMPADIVAPSLDQTPVKGLSVGVYVFQLAVTDNDNATESDQVTVTVVPPDNRPPVADAGPNRVVTLTPTNNSVVLNGSNSRDPEGSALTYEWEVLDAPGTAPTLDDPKSATPKVSGLVAGTYKFGLRVKDDKEAEGTTEVSVTVIIREVSEKLCGPISEIIGAFGKLGSGVPDNTFKLFRELFRYYDEATEYFGMLKKIQREPIEKQLEFFASRFNDQGTPELIMKWLERLQEIILERKDLRAVALTLYRILVNLSMYVVCIQKEDFDKAKVPMEKVFAMMREHIRQWQEPISSGVFSEEDLEVISWMSVDVEIEIDRVNQNGEEGIKTRYIGGLKTILKMLKSFA